jgi:hypothetical protein
MIYITEAHPADVWPIGMSAGTINYKHQNIKDRSKYAIKFQKEYDTHFPILLDNMESDYENTYSCWPFRYHIVLHNAESFVMSFVPEPVDSEFELEEMTLHLQELEQ